MKNVHNFQEKNNVILLAISGLSINIIKDFLIINHAVFMYCIFNFFPRLFLP